MLRTKILPFAFLLGVLISSGCRKMDMPTETPKCVLDRLQNFKHDCCPESASVREYLFQGRTVFVFDQGYCIADGASEVVDENCGTLGYLGGLMGNSTINGENFNHAVLQQTIWSN